MCAADFADANHYLQVELESENISVHASQKVTLSAKDQDINNLELTYKWWCYYEASTYWDFSNINLEADKWHIRQMEFTVSKHSDVLEQTWKLPMENADTSTLTVSLPADAKKGDTFHIVLEVSNVCDTPLKTYRRVIITIE